MEIFTLLETLEDMLENSKKVPFTTRGMVDKEEMLEIIKEIRIKLPDELKQAKWVKEERQRILVENVIVGNTPNTYYNLEGLTKENTIDIIE